MFTAHLSPTESLQSRCVYIRSNIKVYTGHLVNTCYIQAGLPFKTKIRSCHIRHTNIAALLNCALTKHYQLSPQLWPIKTTGPCKATSDKSMRYQTNCNAKLCVRYDSKDTR